jgi:glycosyltransferase involved in cell wall biosynthesis
MADSWSDRSPSEATLERVEQLSVSGWDDIESALDRIRGNAVARVSKAELAQRVAFVTFDYGIDGVSIEIGKYARCIETIVSEMGTRPTIHLIGGDFHPHADAVLSDRWPRFRLEKANGWGKWDGGTWFRKLFFEDMPEGSRSSGELAVEIWQQALELARSLCAYLRAHEIRLLINVNVNSNPGNLAYALATVLTSELTGAYVINSNHDFFWEGGRPASERSEADPPGVRDHFFRNHSNQSFFRVLERVLPWNGARWLQVNINRLQSQRLIGEYGFSSDRVFEIGTGLDEEFFSLWGQPERRSARHRMAHILSDGTATIRPVPVRDHLERLGAWMTNQTPVVCGSGEGLELDTTSDSALVLLQPTRILTRKRIERDWWLVGALLAHEPFRDRFEADKAATLTLHITGPVPIEHEADLTNVLISYRDLCERLPEEIAERLFVAFSIGREDHPALRSAGLEPLNICAIYRMANLVLLPSETEGRGLPIVESNAIGVPIVCSRYDPVEVFDEVCGMHLPPDQRLGYVPFPDLHGPSESVRSETLGEITDCLLHAERVAESVAANRRAARLRYGLSALESTFRRLLDHLAN